MSAFSRYSGVKDRLLAMLESGSTMAEIVAALDITRSMVLNYRQRLMDEKQDFIKLPTDEEGTTSVVVSDHKQININRNIVDKLVLPVEAKDRLVVKCKEDDNGYVITLSCAKKKIVVNDRSNEVAAA